MNTTKEPQIRLSLPTMRGGYRMLGSWAIVHAWISRREKMFAEAEFGIAFRRSIFTFRVTRQRPER